jgi:hypothetical protein
MTVSALCYERFHEDNRFLLHGVIAAVLKCVLNLYWKEFCDLHAVTCFEHRLKHLLFCMSIYVHFGIHYVVSQSMEFSLRTLTSLFGRVRSMVGGLVGGLYQSDVVVDYGCASKGFSCGTLKLPNLLSKCYWCQILSKFAQISIYARVLLLL